MLICRPKSVNSNWGRQNAVARPLPPQYSVTASVGTFPDAVHNDPPERGVRKVSLTMKENSPVGGAAMPELASPSLARKSSRARTAIPSVHLTQQDFVSTFPWGIRGDRVRIIQQEVENALLDAETLAAMAFMLGSPGSSERLDEAWMLLLNAQNHDVHVCLRDEAGMEWCGQAAAIAAEVRQEAAAFIAARVGGPAIALNTLSWSRPLTAGIAEVPAFGYAVAEADDAFAKPQEDRGAPWNGWFRAGTYNLRLREDGCLETRIGRGDSGRALLGNLTMYAGGKTWDSRLAKPDRMEAWLSRDGKRAFARLEGRINDVSFVHSVAASETFLDIETTFDYANGCFFGPEAEDFEEEPRRAHYFQHERKLCMNWQVPDAKTRLLVNSPFLTWPAPRSRSVESLHFAALQAQHHGIAHFNVGQSGYGYIEEDSLCRHVLAFAPRRYVYGKPEIQELKGLQTHRCRFMPYRGDWRKAKLPLRAREFQRPMILLRPGRDHTDAPRPLAGAALARGRQAARTPEVGLVRLDSNTTIATALFERNGRLYVRLWEWAGQADSVTLRFGDGKTPLMECSHALKQVGAIKPSFPMRAWEVKTVELVGKAEPLHGPGLCSEVRSLTGSPQGWRRRNRFRPAPPKRVAIPRGAKDAVIYFSSGYHDGFVRPLEKHTPTMEIEMQRVRSPKYPNYTSTWEIGGSCWVSIGKNEPEYIDSLKPYLKDGSIEIVGGTWSEPLSLTISGEANIRQLLYGLEATQKCLGIDIDVYMNQEHGIYAQMPQILRSFGLRAVVNRTQWAPFGYESGLDEEVADWVGVDGSSIPMIPRHDSMGYSTFPGDGRRFQNGSLTGHNKLWRTREKFLQMRDAAIARGVSRPLMTMLEDIWAPGLRSSDAEMDLYASLPFVRFTTIARYLAMVGITF